MLESFEDTGANIAVVPTMDYLRQQQKLSKSQKNRLRRLDAQRRLEFPQKPVVFPGDHTAACMSEWKPNQLPMCSHDCVAQARGATLERLECDQESPVPELASVAVAFSRNDCGCLSALGKFEAAVHDYPIGCADPSRYPANEQAVLRHLESRNKKRRL